MNKEKLELLSLSENFEIKKEDAHTYSIISLCSDLEAEICDNEIRYYLNGCYNSSTECIEIDVLELNKLIAFCNLISK